MHNIGFFRISLLLRGLKRSCRKYMYVRAKLITIHFHEHTHKGPVKQSLSTIVYDTHASHSHAIFDARRQWTMRFTGIQLKCNSGIYYYAWLGHTRLWDTLNNVSEMCCTLLQKCIQCIGFVTSLKSYVSCAAIDVTFNQFGRNRTYGGDYRRAAGKKIISCSLWIDKP